MAAVTGLSSKQESAFRRKELSAQQREELLKPFLPTDISDSDTQVQKKKALRERRQRASQQHHRKPLVGPFKALVHLTVYHVVALLFSIFFRFRRAYRLVRGKVISLLKYHHRTPEFIAHDVKDLEKLPKHLSVIVEYQEDDGSQGNAGLEGLVNDVCEIAAWAASAGIPFLSIYERTGKLAKSTNTCKEAVQVLTAKQASSRTTCPKPMPVFGVRLKPTLAHNANPPSPSAHRI